MSRASPPDDFDPAEAWEHFGRRAVLMQVHEQQARVDERFHDAREALEADAFGPEELAALRQALARALSLAEHELAPLAGREPWDDVDEHLPPHYLYPELAEAAEQWRERGHGSDDGDDDE